MMIAVEGPDNSGKTTLAGVLARYFRYPLDTTGGPPISDFHRLECLSTQLINVNSKMIYDRLTCISDSVYRMDLYDPILIAFRKEMIERCILIYCRPPKEILMKVENHIATSKNDTEEQVNLVKAYQSTFVMYYDVLMKTLNPIRYDYTQGSVKDLIKHIEFIMDRRRV